MAENADLFESQNTPAENILQGPLANRVRPLALDEVVGQDHILAEGKLLRRLIALDRWPSIIFYGPAGSGKTTLAKIIAGTTRARFVQLNAVTSNVAELKAVIDAAEKLGKFQQKKTILFIDEIHRFNKSQQDVLMPFVENGTVSLVGATTHNPAFSVNAPLLSRSTVFELKPLTEPEIICLLKRAVGDPRSGFGGLKIHLEDAALAFIARQSDGDGRRALNALEIAVATTPPDDSGQIQITRQVASESCQRKIVHYDKDEDYHYDTISAFIKSMRGSEPHSAVYWLAKMLYAGEDPRFIIRRMMIFASEDIGNADPQALLLTGAGLEAVEFVGMPEVQIILSHIVTYLALAPKSNASYLAIHEAMDDVKNQTTDEVPAHLRDSHYPQAAKLGHGEGYVYPHGVRPQSEAGKMLKSQKYSSGFKKYYRPNSIGFESQLLNRLKNLGS